MIQSSILQFDGQDFIRQHTTLQVENGSSAVGTKLDHSNPGYKMLLNKQSFSGKVMLFGKESDAHYAPLIDSNGQLTGALMVCLQK